METLQYIGGILSPEIIQTTISGYTNALIRKMETGKTLTDKGKLYTPSTIRTYKMFYDNLLNFEEKYQTKFELNQINYKFGKEFQLFLIRQNLTKNSISTILSKFKAVMKLAFMDGLSYWNGSGLKTPTERTSRTYFTLSELNRLRQTNLTDSEKRVLDTFVIQCFTGLRYSTLRKFLKNPFSYIHETEGKLYLDIVADKTDEQSVVPIGETVTSILSKYPSGKIKISTEWYYSRTMKTITQKAGISQDIVVRRTIGGTMQETFESKYKKISSHTARITFITLLKQTDISDKKISAMTGQTESQMNHYNRSEKFDMVKDLIGHGFFDVVI
ncbi:MAG: site-specific integrase [Flavobacteriaceae bacterium]|jgi:site-specific recombinase XerD|nr:site-specific integrase [Flavobacteriaceae bacterium]